VSEPPSIGHITPHACLFRGPQPRPTISVNTAHLLTWTQYHGSFNYADRIGFTCTRSRFIALSDADPQRWPPAAPVNRSEHPLPPSGPRSPSLPIKSGPPGHPRSGPWPRSIASRAQRHPSAPIPSHHAQYPATHGGISPYHAPSQHTPIIDTDKGTLRSPDPSPPRPWPSAPLQPPSAVPRAHRASHPWPAGPVPRRP
jgi:hypothetical protein